MQYDVRSGEVALEYNYHLGPVNAILFIDENRRIVTTSDDKKARSGNAGDAISMLPH